MIPPQAPPLFAFVDGSVVSGATRFIHGDDLGLVRGDGIFDATLGTRAGARDLEAHLARFTRSARMLDLPDPDLDGMRRAIAALLAAWPFELSDDLVIRIVMTRGREVGGEPTLYAHGHGVAPTVYSKRLDGIGVVTLNRGFDATTMSDSPWLLAGAKSLSYAVNMAAQREAVRRGADDAVFVASDGSLLESPRAAIVIARNGELLTPDQDVILPSITLAELAREAPLRGMPVRLTRLTREDLTTGDGAWLVSSVQLVAPIRRVDGVPIPEGPHDDLMRGIFGIDGAGKTFPGP